MKDKQFQKWQKKRQKGQARFVLVNGVLAWGVGMFLVKNLVFRSPGLSNMSLGLILSDLFVWAAVGLAFGYFSWVFSERAYLDEVEARKDN